MSPRKPIATALLLALVLIAAHVAFALRPGLHVNAIHNIMTGDRPVQVYEVPSEGLAPAETAAEADGTGRSSVAGDRA